MIAKGFLYVLLMSFFWSLNVVLAGYAFTLGANIYVYGYQTFIFASICLMIYLIYNRNYSIKSLKKSHIIILLFFGILANGVGNYFGLEGIRASALNYGFLIKTSVIFVLLLEMFLSIERLTITKVLLTILLLLGVFLISTKGKMEYPNIGDVYTIISAFCFGFVNVISKPFLVKNSPVFIALFRSIGGGIFLFLLAFYTHNDLLELSFVPFSSLGGIFVFLLFMFLYKALNITSASYVSMVSMSFSIFTAILSYIFLDQKFLFIQIIGAFIIVVAVILVELSKNRNYSSHNKN